ncbi:MAG: proton-translocating transhydrogenase family protein [Alphaproteobacteria bacterium]|nr:proton-translocating transhydrogenase family protein [Alphaproteobacteria bacterium]
MAENLNQTLDSLNKQAQDFVGQLDTIANQAMVSLNVQSHLTQDPFIQELTVFILACFVGYYVVWKVTPALHSPLMSVTNAISSVVIVGALIALGINQFGLTQILGFVAVFLASINIFGGFMITRRMLGMFKKKR